jgi:hypothetical protein
VERVDGGAISHTARYGHARTQSQMRGSIGRGRDGRAGTTRQALVSIGRRKEKAPADLSGI